MSLVTIRVLFKGPIVCRYLRWLESSALQQQIDTFPRATERLLPLRPPADVKTKQNSLLYVEFIVRSTRFNVRGTAASANVDTLPASERNRRYSMPCTWSFLLSKSKLTLQEAWRRNRWYYVEATTHKTSCVSSEKRLHKCLVHNAFTPIASCHLSNNILCSKHGSTESFQRQK